MRPSVDGARLTFTGRPVSPLRRPPGGRRRHVTEQEEFAERDPPAEVLDLFDLASAQKAEHYEIAAYDTPILLADQVGHDDAADLLEKNLREEDAPDEFAQITENYDFESVPWE